MPHFFNAFTSIVLSTLLGGAVVATATAQASNAAAPAKPSVAKPAFPSLRLNEMSNGAAAIAKLGTNLPAVAAFYGKTPAEFAKLLRTDRSTWLDKSGRLFYAEPSSVVAPSNATPANAMYPLDQTFLLHSRPGSKRKIYLDFNGHTTTNSNWNSSYRISSIVSRPYDIDSVPGTFNATELSNIQNAWRMVAEDFAPFDVDVTTEEPPADQLSRSPWFSDDTYGIRAVITPDNFADTPPFYCNCNGIAQHGGFDEVGDANKPVFIFATYHWDAKLIGDVISHEVGHSLSLSHDGTSAFPTYAGYTTAYGGWAPIMGSSHFKAVAQFSKGEYPDANNKEDDYLVMHNNGVSVVADDVGNSTATARALTGTALNGTSTLDARGLIETPADIDVFKFFSSPGTLTVTAAAADFAANLNIRVEVRNPSGVLIAQSNPSESFSASLSVAIPTAGTHYVSIQGAGDDVAIHTSDYGSLGRYAVRVTAPVTGTAPTCKIGIAAYSGPDFNTITFSGSGSSDTSGSIQLYRWDFGDGSATGSGISATHTYHNTGSYVTRLTVTNTAGMSSTCNYAHDVEVLSG